MIEKLKTAVSRTFLSTLDQVFDSVDTEGQAAHDSTEETGKEVTDQPTDQMPMFEERLARLEEFIAQLKAAKKEDPSTEVEITTDSCNDVDTIARAEILSPGIAKTGDLKRRALEACYATNDGRQIIDTLLVGKVFDSADQDMLFVAASELVKDSRRNILSSSQASNLSSLHSGPMTPKRLNEINAARYGLKN